MKIRVKKLHQAAILPSYATAGAACFDLHAATVEGNEAIGSIVTDLLPVTCRTGLAFEIPDGHVMLIFSRSGHGFKHNVRLANCVGVIDSDYRGEVAVKLTCDEWGDDGMPLLVTPGDRIAQALIMPLPAIEFELADSLSDTERGAQGFGSTGA